MNFKLLTLKVKKSIFGEIKRQDAGRGNAHERVGKFWMPGVIRTLRERANQPDNVCPMWVIFTGGIATDERRIREIEHWFSWGRRTLSFMAKFQR